MQSIFETVPQLAAYQTAFSALAILVVAIIIQAFLTGALALGPGHQMAGMPLQGTNTDFSFRVMRTYGNSVENLPMFATALLLTILAGVSPPIINWLAMLHVFSRLLYWAVYYSGIGNPGFGPRTIVYVIGLGVNLLLAGLALWTMIF